MSLMVIVHCTHCSVCHMVFPMWLLRLYCRVSVVLLALEVGPVLGWWVWCHHFEGEGWGGGGFMAGRVLARP